MGIFGIFNLDPNRETESREYYKFKWDRERHKSEIMNTGWMCAFNLMNAPLRTARLHCTYINFILTVGCLWIKRDSMRNWGHIMKILWLRSCVLCVNSHTHAQRIWGPKSRGNLRLLLDTRMEWQLKTGSSVKHEASVQRPLAGPTTEAAPRTHRGWIKLKQRGNVRNVRAINMLKDNGTSFCNIFY